MSLEEHRKEIDKIDSEILELLAKRDKIIEKVKIFKEKNGIERIQKGRWEKLLKDKIEKGKGLGIDEGQIIEIWEVIHKYSLKKQNYEQ